MRIIHYPFRARLISSLRENHSMVHDPSKTLTPQRKKEFCSYYAHTQISCKIYWTPFPDLLRSCMQGDTLGLQSYANLLEVCSIELSGLASEKTCIDIILPPQMSFGIKHTI